MMSKSRLNGDSFIQHRLSSRLEKLVPVAYFFFFFFFSAIRVRKKVLLKYRKSAIANANTIFPNERARNVELFVYCCYDSKRIVHDY